MIEITGVKGREILDSRGNPTVEVEVYTENGYGRASVPSGASTGRREAYEKRDGDTSRFGGRGVLNAVEMVNTEIRDALTGMDVLDQANIDRQLIELDGTDNKSRLGANAIVGASMAVCRAAANSLNKPLFRYIAEDILGGHSVGLPIPVMNVINGGKHAGNELSIQEFLILPSGYQRYADNLRAGVETYHALKTVLKRRYGTIATNIGDEGGYAPPMKRTDEPLDAIMAAIREAGYTEREIKLGIDAAASSFFNAGKYRIDGTAKTGEELLEFYQALLDSYPIELIEDPFEEESFSLFSAITAKMPQVIIVGDDLFVTNVQRLRKGIEHGAANAVLLKLNQIGSVTETIETARVAKENGYKCVVSHRSGETEDTFIADLAVAINAEFIKTGAPARGERTCKYNQLLRIENVLAE